MCIVKKFEQELRLSKSEQTVRSYAKQFSLFVDYFKGKDLRYLSSDVVKKYVLLLHSIYGYSSIVHAISAIKFYYKHINGRTRILDIPNPPKPKTIPTVLSIDEVKRMVQLTTNLKHRAIIETMFYHGLRRSELINLKIEHIDSPNNKLRIIQSKGLKDRDIPLSVECLNTLRLFYKIFKPTEYLFNGQTGGKYSETSLTNIIKQAAQRAGINKHVYPHTLRHSFATHLVSLDINLAKISAWMGHNNIKTTELYCHITNQNNPITLTI